MILRGYRGDWMVVLFSSNFLFVFVGSKDPLSLFSALNPRGSATRTWAFFTNGASHDAVRTKIPLICKGS